MRVKIHIESDENYQEIIKYLDNLGFKWNTGKKLSDHKPEKEPKWIFININSPLGSDLKLYKYITYSSQTDYIADIFELSTIESVESILFEINDTIDSYKKSHPYFNTSEIFDVIDQAIMDVHMKVCADSNFSNS